MKIVQFEEWQAKESDITAHHTLCQLMVIVAVRRLYCMPHNHDSMSKRNILIQSALSLCLTLYSLVFPIDGRSRKIQDVQEV